MVRRCDICGARVAEHYCYRCENAVCSSCIDENGLLCKNCKIRDDNVEGIRIGFSPLRKMVNLPLFILGIAIIIAGMATITWSSVTIPSAVEQAPSDEPRGFIYIFPFPFVFGVGSSDASIMLPLMIAVIAIPIILILLMFRNFARFW